MNCEGCGGDLQREAIEIEVRIGQPSHTVRQPGWYCWQCGSARFSAEDLAIADRQLRAAGPNAPVRAIGLSAGADRPAKAA